MGLLWQDFRALDLIQPRLELMPLVIKYLQLMPDLFCLVSTMGPFGRHRLRASIALPSLPYLTVTHSGRIVTPRNPNCAPAVRDSQSSIDGA